MSSDLIRIYISNEVFDFVLTKGHDRIPVLRLEGDITSVNKMDFILLVNSKGDIILKHFWDSTDGYIEYTSVFAGNSRNIALQAVCSVMYDCLMKIRTETAIERMEDYLTFPKKSVFQNVILLRYCIGLLKGNKAVKNCDDISLNKINSLMNILSVCQYPLTNVDSKLLTKLEQQIDLIELYVGNIFMWKRIHQIAYEVHNIPGRLCFYDETMSWNTVK